VKLRRNKDHVSLLKTQPAPFFTQFQEPLGHSQISNHLRVKLAPLLTRGRPPVPKPWSCDTGHREQLAENGGVGDRNFDLPVTVVLVRDLTERTRTLAIPLYVGAEQARTQQQFYAGLISAKSHCPVQRQLGRSNSLTWRRVSFLFYSGFQLIGGVPLTLERTICFLQSTHSNVNLI
jgi:hypothetical protein